MKKQVIVTFVITSLLLFSTVGAISTLKGDDYFFTLEIHFWGGGWSIDHALLSNDFLKEINVNAYIPVEYRSFSSWFAYLKEDRDWDIAAICITDLNSQDMRKYFMENGSRNVFSLNSALPYYNECEEFQYKIAKTNNLEEKSQLQRDWQSLLMDKMLPILPVYSSQDFEAVWSNVLGYDAEWGLSDSLSYMSFDGYHEGQDNLTELNGAYPLWWTTLNPIYGGNLAELPIIDLIFEPLLQWSPDLNPLKTGIIKEWTKINATHYVFQMRDDVFWNPSYNTTIRTELSNPLISTPEEELMLGLKGENCNGTNQQVTAKDAVFTLLALSKYKAGTYRWLANCFVDQDDELEFHVTMNVEPKTVEQIFYEEFWKLLSVPLLPEFFLNSSDPFTSYTKGNQSYIGLYPGIAQTPQWLTYSKSAFGCGKYMLDYCKWINSTVLKRSPYWFGRGAIDGTIQNCEIETIKINYISRDSESYSEFKSGKQDYLSYLSKYYQEPEIRELQSNPNFVVNTPRSSRHYFFVFNFDRPIIGGENNYIWLAEPGKTDYTKAAAIRKAICYAIDNEEMNQLINEGDYILNYQPNPYIKNYDGATFPIQYDRNLTLAKEWMEAAGYSFDVITLQANSNLVMAVICIVLTSISVYKNRIGKERKRSKLVYNILRK
ncbi:MAG: hypothetical protein H7641_01670 [Candidatus Heimdallarchaeota archaeon]|nr:hypothetical protein [Candidatus Heimdallarchaeota archaeon]MCK4876271.1 hypothetical protein [Candidatus Heimdallarchaeota archaeon]